ncbi:kinase-like protein [Corynespora cassiicola Philippines]|uniref:Kinase-like protein n=1 Tax=Corynespora cassiicola Philippines TaxID=1448308 RepID=A0A2T2N6B0_CORCC|nr:kinase-like protein [Corynespora cassiicola Philippines]
MVRAVRQLRKPTDFIVQKFPAIRYGLRHRRKIIEFSEHLEEERDAHHFDQQPFYPVDIGATLHSRYKVIGKVGYGMNGTVWLCRDTSTPENHFVVVKVGRCNSPQSDRESLFYSTMNSDRTMHPGRHLIRTMLDNFTLVLPNGRYGALVHPPLSISLGDLRKTFPYRQVPLSTLQPILRDILLALDFIHNRDVVHTDINEGNVLFKLHSNKPLETFELQEYYRPTAQKFLINLTVYGSRKLPAEKILGAAVLTDFGLAQRGQQNTLMNVQPKNYRCPEALFHIPWDCKIDVWNVGTLTYWLLANNNLFLAKRPPTDEYDSLIHAISIADTIGVPPDDFIAKRGSERMGDEWNLSDYVVERWRPLDEQLGLANVQRPQKQQVVEFLQGCLQWRPEDRATAAELLQGRLLGQKEPMRSDARA